MGGGVCDIEEEGPMKLIILIGLTLAIAGFLLALASIIMEIVRWRK